MYNWMKPFCLFNADKDDSATPAPLLLIKVAHFKE